MSTNNESLDYLYISEGAIKHRRIRNNEGKQVSSIEETMEKLENDLKIISKQKDHRGNMDFER